LKLFFPGVDPLFRTVILYKNDSTNLIGNYLTLSFTASTSLSQLLQSVIIAPTNVCPFGGANSQTWKIPDHVNSYQISVPLADFQYGDLYRWNIALFRLMGSTTFNLQIQQTLPPPNSPPNNPNSRMNLIIGLSSGGGALLIVIVGVISVIIYRKRKNDYSALN